MQKRQGAIERFRANKIDLSLSDLQ